MGKSTSCLTVYIDKEVYNKFYEVVYKDYFRGKIKKVIEDLLKKYISENKK